MMDMLMAVYVDSLLPCIRNKNWRYDKACHLVADSVDELHLFAEKIGLKRSWFQNKSIPHYDLTAGMRTKAIIAGAIVIGREKFVEIINKYRQELAGTGWKK